MIAGMARESCILERNRSSSDVDPPVLVRRIHRGQVLAGQS
jgi:hypothetical protein